MCGISGFNWEDKSLIKTMISKLRHRGPDQSGIYLDNGISLGHSRLAVIDLSSKGKQPMSDQEGDLVITFNGEIYNYLELKKDSKIMKYNFKSSTDTEVILYLYREYGIKMLDMIEGMFAFCIYDKKKKVLFLARDMFGKKPLYYTFDGDRFVFSSEMKSIIIKEPKLKINQLALKEYLSFGYVVQPQTIFENIKQLEPASYMVFDLKNKCIKIKKYERLRYSQEITSEKFAIKKLDQLFEDSIKKRVISDVPLGAFLSGGVDSSAVVYYLSKLKSKIHTFSVGFDYKDYDESNYSNMVSQHLGTTHHHLSFSSDSFIKTLERMKHIMDEPFSDSSIIPTYLVSKLAKKFVTVSLSGDGGDELFGGYHRYSWMKFLMFQNRIPTRVIKIATKVINGVNKIVPNYYLQKGKLFLKYYNMRDYEIYSSIMKIEKNKDKYLDGIYKKYFIYPSMLKNALNSDVHLYLNSNNLFKVDRASMANSLEVRCPILDKHIFEFSSNINDGLLIKNGQRKYILKKLMMEKLPKEILYRKKKGFAVPVRHYFKKEAKSYLINNLELLQRRRIISNVGIKKDVKSFFSNRLENSNKLFNLLQFELFLKSQEKEIVYKKIGK